MSIDGWDDLDSIPRKWMDKKQYIRINPVDGLPQLIRIEPIINEAGELIPDSVTVHFDDGAMLIMERLAAENYIEAMNCTPLEVAAQGKNYWIH